MRKIGEDISVARRIRRIAADDFARRIGISRATLHRLENGDPRYRVQHSGDGAARAWPTGCLGEHRRCGERSCYDDADERRCPQADHQATPLAAAPRRVR
ncbi:helix-turn-helix transcriptional regulator [Rhizobium favelukesii]|uniref:helix-turn-helix domain-containing protein n=2 Tax=Rhizobium/Agrobacterium group TaxID=227290 RepID=UPI001CD30DD7|nr:helix-turn-helix transcriptional regulator [Rhizobium sp. T1473]MCS0460778.1 helix-turn-helix transcriptional regulator [Rhizobium favelukesii]